VRPTRAYDAYLRAHQARREGAGDEARSLAAEARAAAELAAERLGREMGVAKVRLFGSLVRAASPGGPTSISP
jgi:hypothetical protein